MNVVSTTCASSHRDVDWHGIDWAKCHRTVRRLQARMVKATHWEAGSREGALRGLSCMPRKRLVQFLGGWGLATAPGYPTLFSGLVQVMGGVDRQERDGEADGVVGADG